MVGGLRERKTQFRGKGKWCGWRLGVLIGAAGLYFLLICSPAYSFNLTLAWDPNNEPDLAGYRIYIGTKSRQYSRYIDVGDQTTATLENLVEGTAYYFTLTAYNTRGVESSFSNEVRFPDWAARVFFPFVSSN